jgi:hypothetical protein
MWMCVMADSVLISSTGTGPWAFAIPCAYRGILAIPRPAQVGLDGARKWS